VLGVRGDVRIAGRTIDGNFGILAYNFFPDNGDMVLDAPDSFYGDTTSASLRLRNVVSHEHGHGLGIDHVCPINETKLMEPFFSDAFTGPQHDDTLAGQRGYGDDRENNDTAATGTNFGSVGNGTLTANGGGLDDNSDLDFYRFTVPAGKQLDVTLTPVGATYLEGPQLSTGNCSAGTPFNSLILNDVALQVIGTNGTTVLASANAQGPGGTEVLNNVALTTAGQFFVRVSGGTADNVQLYNLSITVEDAAVADLTITKTDGQSTATPGQPVTYTIVATNTSGSLTVNGATVADTFPAALSGVTWTCAASAGSSCVVGSGSGNINRTVNLLPGGTVTFTATGNLAPGATGTLVNTATVAPPVGVADPTPANNTATDTDTLVPSGDLAITKTDGQASEVPGTPVTYTIVATNAGPSTATGASVADTFPAAITGVAWTCAASAGSACSAPSGAGNIATAVTLLPAGTATFTATGTISASATGTLANTATIAAPGGFTDPNAANNSATDTDTLTPTADLGVTKTDGQPSAVPGTAVTYTITVSNAGPSVSGTATVADTFPAALTGATWTCSGSGGASCPASGAGSIAAAVTLPPAGVVTFTATATIDPTATGTLANTASAAVPGGVTDPVAGNNSATDSDTLTPQADFGITKTDGQLTATPGSPVTYTIQVTQGGPSASGAATVTDVFPPTMSGVNWTCTASAGSSCP
ncbi:MAG TPA: matrixin family metalloprotease, partial [Vicinamibacteria bacterium]|nr:matrixin family metalloprotease [Vicinamibacteria bacterium]